MTQLSPKLISLVQNEAELKHPPATRKLVDQAQSKAGFTFPPSYVQFLTNVNGCIFSYARIFGTGVKDLDLFEQQEGVQEMLDETAVGAVFPFASDWGGSRFCFDLSNPSAGGEFPILFWSHEYSETPGAEELWTKVGDSFGDFLTDLAESL